MERITNPETAWAIARDFVFSYEGGFQNREDDPGNWTGGAPGKGELKGTKYGISAKSYPQLEISILTQEQAEVIYRRDYWKAIKGDELPGRFAVAAFDGAVLQGCIQTVFTLQRALGVAADGAIGPGTIGAAGMANDDPEDAALLRFLAERAVAIDKTILARPSMIAWAGNWELRMFKLARLIFK